MPRYRYRCGNCQKEWWQWMGIKDPQPDKCPNCDCKTIHKVPTNFVTKNKSNQKEKSAKENVVDHIEDNREILKNMKIESKQEAK